MNDPLTRRLLSVIRRGAGASLSEEEFTELALAVFLHQYEKNRTYRAYCDRAGIVPGSAERWLEIPAVPADAFKAAALSCGDPADAAAVFRTSGTTRGAATRGTHYLMDTRLYREALRKGFEHHVLRGEDRLRTFSLIPPASEVPDSSLSFMISEVVAAFGAEGSGFFVTAGALRLHDLVEELTRAAEETVPVLILGTSLAFVHLLDAMAARGAAFQAAPRSRVMDTGGFKGHSKTVSREELYAGIALRLGIPPDWIVNEYGMTEMSSQFYDGMAGNAGPATGRVYQAPGWVRSIAVDPETLDPLPAGETGVLRHLDLANLDSVLALQTADLGRLTPGGGFELFGRATGASVRGCSVAMDELLDAIGSRSAS